MALEDGEVVGSMAAVGAHLIAAKAASMHPCRQILALQ